jgi:hypothetical protein
MKLITNKKAPKCARCSSTPFIPFTWVLHGHSIHERECKCKNCNLDFYVTRPRLPLDHLSTTMDRPPSPDEYGRPPSPDDFNDDRNEGSENSDDEATAGEKTTPPLPPFSPADAASQPSYAAQEVQGTGSHNTHDADIPDSSEGQLLDDIFPRPPPRDVAAAAIEAVNSALGGTSPPSHGGNTVRINVHLLVYFLSLLLELNGHGSIFASLLCGLG